MNYNWHKGKILKYVDKKFGKYDDEIEWYTDPDYNMVKFEIPSLHLLYILTCTDKGKILEETLATT